MRSNSNVILGRLGSIVLAPCCTRFVAIGVLRSPDLERGHGFNYVATIKGSSAWSARQALRSYDRFRRGPSLCPNSTVDSHGLYPRQLRLALLHYCFGVLYWGGGTFLARYWQHILRPSIGQWIPYVDCSSCGSFNSCYFRCSRPKLWDQNIATCSWIFRRKLLASFCCLGHVI